MQGSATAEGRARSQGRRCSLRGKEVPGFGSSCVYAISNTSADATTSGRATSTTSFARACRMRKAQPSEEGARTCHMRKVLPYEEGAPPM